MKIHPVGAELFHSDGRTDMKKLIAAFCYFVKAPKKEIKTRMVSMEKRYNKRNRGERKKRVLKSKNKGT
jgi:inhibitor of KinA sporulation pathway (predicted exonuclease)